MIDTKHESVAFFRHVPKTAGTSLITTLSNIFGDAHCHRFEAVDHEFAATFGRVMNERQGSLALISGHVPLSVMAPGLAGSEFTVLREPIARVLSLRRFLERRPPAERAQLGLGDSISIDELLASNAPTIYAQVRNGMTRFFSDAGGFNDPMTVEFWLATPGNETLAAAADAAARMAIGTVEDMSGTLSALGQLLRVPYPLEVPVENTTTDASEEEISPGEYRRLVEANVADIAIYHAIRSRRTSIAERRPLVSSEPYDTRTVFNPSRGTTYRADSIAGRQGFSAGEPSGMTWLGPSGVGRIHVAPAQEEITLRLDCYAVVPHYPLHDVTITVDRARWPAEAVSGQRFPTLRLAPLPRHDSVIELAIHQPWAVPVSAIAPQSPDARSLGLGLVSVTCETT
ncbi:MAG: hypothetical protein ACKO5R_11480 [Planctomycetaceae bacterium]